MELETLRFTNDGKVEIVPLFSNEEQKCMMESRERYVKGLITIQNDLHKELKALDREYKIKVIAALAVYVTLMAILAAI